VVFTVFTDSLALYGSRLAELSVGRGTYERRQADRDYERLTSLSTDHLLELSHIDRRRVHNLKYFTWIEQLGKDIEELRRQWSDHRSYWGELHEQVSAIDSLIEEFNRKVSG